MGRDKGRGKPLPWEVGWIHGALSLFSETLTTAAQRAGGIYVDFFQIVVRLFLCRPLAQFSLLFRLV